MRRSAGVTTSSIVARAHPQALTDDGWRGRVRAVAERGARASMNRSIAALSEREGVLAAEVLVLVPGGDEAVAAKAADGVLREMQASLPGYTFALGRSRIAEDPAHLPRAASEALLAANVAQGGGDGVALAFEQTGAYRLLLSAMSRLPFVSMVTADGLSSIDDNAAVPSTEKPYSPVPATVVMMPDVETLRTREPPFPSTT